jgi:hypothetical protein
MPLRSIRVMLATAFVMLASLGSAFAQSCTREDLAAAVDEAGARLRTAAAQGEPRLADRKRRLKEARGWSDAEAEERFHEAVDDDRVALLERMANEQLERVDQLGVVAPGAVVECRRIEEVRAAARELEDTMRARIDHVVARVDTLLAPPRAAQAPPSPASPQLQPQQQPNQGPPPAAQAPPQVQPAQQTAQAPAAAARPAPAPRPPAPPAVASPPAPAVDAAPAPPPWSTTTTIATTEDPGETYTIEEIRLISQGIFGKVSAGLGSIVEHAFSSAGRPTAYIIGDEGSGALIAGFRFGSGILYMRNGATMPIYWHGPSIGTDIGAAGAKVMYLVYKLRDPDQMFRPFTSLEGSAFVVGGVGFNLMTNGTVQTAPIRSGLGIRIGASIGYVRFTRRPSWNPF